MIEKGELDNPLIQINVAISKQKNGFQIPLLFKSSLKY